MCCCLQADAVLCASRYTYIKVKGEWRYLYRAVDKYGKTIDFLLTEQHDEQAAKTFLTKAIRRHGRVPETITIDGSVANAAAIKSYNAEHGTRFLSVRSNTSIISLSRIIAV
jgi:transposase-like protein